MRICCPVLAAWRHRFGPMFEAELRKRRISDMKSSNWCLHLSEMFVKTNGECHYLWRAVDHEGEVLDSVVTKRRNMPVALKLLENKFGCTPKRRAKPSRSITICIINFCREILPCSMIQYLMPLAWASAYCSHFSGPFLFLDGLPPPQWAYFRWSGRPSRAASDRVIGSA